MTRAAETELPLIQGGGLSRQRSVRFTVSNEALQALKWLALALMVLDHVNKYVLKDAVPTLYGLGRLCMPLFVYVLGCNLARLGMLDNGGYRRLTLKLAVFGAVASVPFVTLNQLVAGWWPLNMMATLLVAVVVAWLLDRTGRVNTVAAGFLFVVGGALVEFWWPAITTCLFVWAWCRQPRWFYALGFVISLAALSVINGNHWALAAVPVIWMMRYWTMPLPQAGWFFYAFYPVHLAGIWVATKC